MVLALTVCGLVVALVVVGLFVFGLRRRLIQRSGGTFDCSLRWDVPGESPTPSGKGWVLRRRPLQRRPDRVVPRLLVRPPPAPRPGALGDRGGRPRRTPRARRSWRCSPTRSCSACLHRGTRLELAMSEDALTGFLAWLEAAPPGQRVNVA